jgi:hypothetical protein
VRRVVMFCRYGATSLLRDGLRVGTQVSIYGAIFSLLVSDRSVV